MSHGKRALGVFFRPPRFPVIVFGPSGVGAARSLAGLAKVLATLPPSRPGTDVKIVDPTGEEFWFDAEHSVLFPGFTIRRWTKKRIIDAYNTRPEGLRLPCPATSSPDRYRPAFRAGSHPLACGFPIRSASPQGASRLATQRWPCSDVSREPAGHPPR